MSNNKTVIFLIASIFLLALSGRAFAVFGYDSWPDCFLEEVKDCGGTDLCGRVSAKYCHSEFDWDMKETRPKSGIFTYGSYEECLKDEIKDCGSSNACAQASNYYCRMYHPKKR